MVCYPQHRWWRKGTVAVVLAAMIGGSPVGFTTRAAAQVMPDAVNSSPSASGTPCESGTLQCVDGVITDMARRFRKLARDCDHDALFALLYLRTTEEYRRTVAADPAFFRDTAYVNREDEAFAADYTGAYDRWHANAGGVPLAWAIAFEAAERHEVSGAGDTLLGMSAHINRDLPFVLARMGLTHPDGSSRKGDHDRVNEILRRVAHGPALEEAAQRFDPSMRNSDIPGTTLDSDVFLQIVITWRELAWQNAVLLANAPTGLARQLVAQTIEQTAATQALALKAAYGYVPPVTSTAPRNAYCAAQ
jgi:hypothetical protein